MADVPGGDDVGLRVEGVGEGGAAGVEVAVVVGYGDFGAAGGVDYWGFDVEVGMAAVFGVAVEIAAGEVAEAAVLEARGDGEDVFVGVRGGDEVGEVCVDGVGGGVPDVAVGGEDASAEVCLMVCGVG